MVRPLTNMAPSNPPTVEKAQHEPQVPWFLTEVTPPLATQSTLVGVANAFGASKMGRFFFSAVSAGL